MANGGQRHIQLAQCVPSQLCLCNLDDYNARSVKQCTGIPC